MRKVRQKHPIATAFSWLLMVFLVLFPKGGFKIGLLPLTWGYLVLAGSLPILIVVRLLAFPLRLNRQAFRALLVLASFQSMMVYAFFMFGVLDQAYAFSSFVSLFVLPYVFLVIYPPFLGMIDGRVLSSYLRNCMLLAALWGIGLFIQHPITGQFLEIPYLTVNAADYGLIETTKHIVRGPFLKLISTYNNGNLYGAATLILLPMYDHLETSRWRRYTIKLALLLTLSRTVWLGLIVNEVAPLLGHFGRQLPAFPIVKLGGTGRRIVAIGLVMGLVLAAVGFIPGRAPLEFLLDPGAGGRVAEVSASTFNILPSAGWRGILEVIYLSALQDYGVLGLIGMVLLMTSPLLLLLWDKRALQSPMRLAAMRGLLVYSVVALSDGAFNFIPLMAFYWFAYMIYIYDWPAFSPVPSHYKSVRHAKKIPQPGSTSGALSNYPA